MEGIREKDGIVEKILAEGDAATQNRIVELFMTNLPEGADPNLLRTDDVNIFIGMVCLYYASRSVLSDFAKAVQLQVIESFLKSASGAALKKAEKLNALDPQEKCVFEAAEKFIRENRYSPSVREICGLCGFPSTNTVHRVIHSLEEKGLISLSGSSARRSIRINP